MANTTDTGNDGLNGNGRLPLHSFFILLKQNGFSVTPAQINDANRVIAKYAGLIKNESELCEYISPLFAQNEDEQKQFKELFDSLLHEYSKPTPDTWYKRSAKHLVKYRTKYITLLVALSITAAAIYLFSDKTTTPPYTINLRKTGSDLYDSFDLKTGETLQISPQLNVNGKSSLQIKPPVQYDWDDGSVIDTTGIHSFKKEGNYIITAIVNVTKGRKSLIDTIEGKIRVCDLNSDLKAINTETNAAIKQGDSVRLGKTLRLNARINEGKPDYIVWSAEGYEDVRNTVFEIPLKTAGTKTITWTAVYDSINSPCSRRGSIELFVYDPSKTPFTASLKPAKGTAAIKPSYKVKWPFWVNIISILTLLSGLLYCLFRWLRYRARKKAALKKEHLQEKYERLVTSFKGKKPPLELPFTNKNYLPLPLPVINELSRQMRRRINDDTVYLDLPRTIQKTIVSGGLFQPVNIPRTQQSEYLVLIDETHKNNQHVKLFDYLIETLNHQNVHVEKYHYREGLQHCYNLNDPGGISLEKLSEKYQRHVLVIFGNAYELLFRYYPIFNYEHLQLLSRWKYKAVLTTVSFPDWGSKEIKGLLPDIPLFPVDAEGLQLFIAEIFDEEKEILPLLNQRRRSFYEVEKIDFEDIEALQKYCGKAAWAVAENGNANDNLLFQWIAGLAVYPKIRWEITLAIGKSILDKHGKTDELNYTNLLRIARIRWMTDGQFPDTMRLELLKRLKKENEVIARETILSLLNEIPAASVNESHFAYEEKEIQRIINEFNLYAYDNVKYAQYKDSESLFEQLWTKKKIQDSPAKVYFKRRNNKWDTLVNKTDTRGQTKNVGIEEYIDPQAAAIVSNRFYNRAIKIAATVFSVLFLGLLAFYYLSKQNIIAGFNEAAARDIRFNYLNNSGDTIYNSGLLLVDTAQETLTSKNETAVRLITDNSSKQITFNAGGKIILDTSFIINRDAYTISLDKTETAVVPLEKTFVRIYLNRQCLDASGAQYKQAIENDDSSFAVTAMPVSENTSGAGNCLNGISFGGKVSADKVNRIIRTFGNLGVNLKIDTGATADYRPSDNEVTIYYRSGPAKPVIYIQFNNRQSRAKVQQLQICLSRRGVFYIPGIEVRSNFSRNEIRYYADSFGDSIRLLQSCLQTVFPGKTFYPVKINSRQSAARAEIWVYDSIPPPVDPATRYFQTGLSNFNAGNYNDAVKNFTEAIANRYKDISVYRYRGQCYTYLKRDEQACADYKTAADGGDQTARNLLDANCKPAEITAEEIMKNVELHVQRNYNDRSGSSIAFTYYLKGDDKYLDKVYRVTYGLLIRNNASVTRSGGFTLKVYQDSKLPDNLEITILTNDKGNAAGNKRLIIDPDIGSPALPNANEIAANVAVHVRKDAAGKSDNIGQAVYTYYLTGGKEYLDNVAEVRYQRPDKRFDEYAKDSYIVSEDRASGFSFKASQSREVKTVYIIIVGKDKSTSPRITKTIIYDSELYKADDTKKGQ